MDILEGLTRQQNVTNRQLRRLQVRQNMSNPAGWIPIGDTWVYASGTTFTLTDGNNITDFSEHYRAGNWIRFKQGGAYLYACITGTAYADPTTTITVSGDTIADAAITDNAVSTALSPYGADIGDFDADQFGSGAAADGEILTADGSGAAAWEARLTFTPGKYTSTSWDGDAKNGNETIDLSAVFGVPAGVKAVVVRLAYEDETPQVTVTISKDSGDIGNGMNLINQVADYWVATVGIVPCDASGDIYWWQNGEIDSVSLTILGYWS